MGIAVHGDLYFWVTRGIARRAGVSIDAAMHDGRLPRATFLRMVERCQACPRAEDCLTYLAYPRGADPSRAGKPCQNALILAELRALAPAVTE
ncbi:DUF6455 family protein [Paenirhodobacter populi]|uniref:DUF6455 domain-containing protein n=1 Tax=Paenirhodobacter populi TaxID=2306993 RepID=A0A443KHJ5_9RHOB|nr:DUF6455 family protein [Sinirhodobacter populi]RWR08036.1 hypothetical protein D2T32_10525 [Sinirhodobacter populi]RWR12367.1 hypothetical protein D2T33_09710 [Sinirhodobacter populi]RWR23606.1 hypothetical protein D2T30_03950 [Sinirhodobacter populi]RWR32224.1 hypothetical protein D2T29_08495 [Sinirhodobacter populi]